MKQLTIPVWKDYKSHYLLHFILFCCLFFGFNQQIVASSDNTKSIDFHSIFTTDYFEQATQITVSGQILDDAGLPLPGATVVEKGTSNATVTDVNGEYSLTVDDQATLVISFLGFLIQKFKLTAEQTFHFPCQKNLLY